MTRPAESTLPDVHWLTVTEVAKYLRIARMTVYRWIEEGKLPAVQIGRHYRVDEEAVKALMRDTRAK